VAIATLRAGGPPSGSAVAEERARVERLVTRANRRAWNRYIAEVAELARAARDDGEVGEARELVLDVVDNHENLKLGLPGGHA
jgi:hypothetical protein